MSEIKANALTAEVVAEYLRDYPDFFQMYPDLVDTLSFSCSERGAVSLVELQLKRQREKISQLEEEITQLMEVAASNDHNFHQFMGLQEQVLKCRSIEQVIQCIEQQADLLGLKSYLKLVDAPKQQYKLSLESCQRFATNHFNGKDAYLGRLKKADCEQLLGIDAPDMGSFVVLPIGKKSSQQGSLSHGESSYLASPMGVIAFFSEDGGHFQPHMDTLFLRHLTLVVSHLFATLEWEKQEASYAMPCGSTQ